MITDPSEFMAHLFPANGDKNPFSILLLAIVVAIVVAEKGREWLTAAGNGIELVFHHITTLHHRSGIFAPYTCCHRCGQSQERVAIPFYPCMCINVRAEIKALRKRHGHVRIEEHPEHGYRVTYGPQWNSCTAYCSTIQAAITRAINMDTDWDMAVTTNDPANAYLDARYEREHQ